MFNKIFEQDDVPGRAEGSMLAHLREGGKLVVFLDVIFYGGQQFLFVLGEVGFSHVTITIGCRLPSVFSVSTAQCAGVTHCARNNVTSSPS